MIAAQWEPAYRLLLVIGTGLAGVGGYLLLRVLLNLPLAALDRWRNRVDPEWQLIDRQQRLDAWFAAEDGRTAYLRENQR